MENFTPLTALAGGALIGLAATLLLWTGGRIAGISGILGGLLPPFARDWGWRLAFLLGLASAPPLWGIVAGSPIAASIPPPLTLMIVGGFLVGFGTRLGSGCTSGHGVCGVSRLSPRSAVATVTFMLVGFVTVFVVRHLLGF